MPNRLNVFLAGIMQGSHAEMKIHDQDWRGPIKRALAEHAPEAEVYDHFEHHPRSAGYEMPEIAETLADGIARVAACDVLVAYVPGASMGTAVEMYEAARNGAVVLTVSPLAANWVLLVYSDRTFADVAGLEAFLAAGGLDELLRSRRSRSR